MDNKLTRLNESQKARLFDRIFASEYEGLLRIDISTEQAETLYAEDPILKKTEGMQFPYEETIERYLMEYSVDTDPEGILHACRIPVLLKELEDRDTFTVYYTVRDADGTLKSKKVIFFPVGEDVIVMAIQDFSTSFRSVSRKMDMLTNELSRAQAAIADKDSFLAMMDQHLRTPLYSIMGLTRIAEDQTADPHSFDDYLHKISMSGTYMQETIDDMLTLRQIARNEIVLNPTIIDLDDFFANIERLIRPAIYAKGMLFERDTWNVSGLQIVADVHYLQQIVLKMLRSTAEYAVRGSRIRLQSRVLYQNEAENTVRLELSVECRGIVIDKERLSILFKPYDYMKDRMDSNMGELDIALVILRSCLLAMGSDQIITESDESKGTRISVSLNLPLGVGKPEPITLFTTPDFTGKKILLVDDNKISRDVSEKLLVNTGASVVKVENGQAALDQYIAAGGDFDLILMDVLMPVMDGLTATRRIRSLEHIPGSGTIPIIALTVNAFQKHFEESLHAGMNAHLVKPIEPAALYQVLIKYIE